MTLIKQAKDKIAFWEHRRSVDYQDLDNADLVKKLVKLVGVQGELIALYDFLIESAELGTSESFYKKLEELRSKIKELREEEMTREEIMGMDERELYEAIDKFVYPNIKGPENIKGFVSSFDDIHGIPFWSFLARCYQAEEKIREMGGIKQKIYIAYLSQFVYENNKSTDYEEFIFAHASPIDRARAILLTINEEQP